MVVGSPPHTRGKVQTDPDPVNPCGITPAYAGKSNSKNDCRRCGEDHPRIRGEKTLQITELSDPELSPPHTRGKDARCFSPNAGLRITPAYAGKRQNYPVF